MPDKEGWYIIIGLITLGSNLIVGYLYHYLFKSKLNLEDKAIKKELEKHSSELEKLRKASEIKLTLLQQERVKAIKDIYPKLIGFNSKLEAFASLSADRIPYEEIIEEQRKTAKALDQLELDLKKVRLFFEGETLRLLDKVISASTKAIIAATTSKQYYRNYNDYIKRGSEYNKSAVANFDLGSEYIDQAMEIIRNDFPDLLIGLEKDFRELLGGNYRSGKKNKES